MAAGIVATVGDIYGADSSPTFFQTAEQAPTSGQAISMPTSATASSALANLDPRVIFPQLQGMNPIFWLPILLGVIVLAKMVREWGSPQDEFRDVKVGFYFIVMASLAATAMIPIYKAILNKYQVPGLTEWVSNA